jgi:hypothetical protein
MHSSHTRKVNTATKCDDASAPSLVLLMRTADYQLTIRVTHNLDLPHVRDCVIEHFLLNECMSRGQCVECSSSSYLETLGRAAVGQTYRPLD